MTTGQPEPPTGRLDGRLIGLGVTGSIAAYKAVELLRLLRAGGRGCRRDADAVRGPVRRPLYVRRALSAHAVETERAGSAARRSDRAHRGRRQCGRHRGRTGDRPLARRHGGRPERGRRHRRLPRHLGSGRRGPGDGRRHVDRTPPPRTTWRGCATASATRSCRRRPDALASGQSGVGRLAELAASSTRSSPPSRIGPIRAADPADRPPLADDRPARRRPRGPPCRRRAPAAPARPSTPCASSAIDPRAGWASRSPRPRSPGGRASRSSQRTWRSRHPPARPWSPSSRPRTCARPSIASPTPPTAPRLRRPRHGRRRRGLPTGTDRADHKLERGAGLTLELEATPDILAQIARIVRGTDRPATCATSRWSAAPVLVGLRGRDRLAGPRGGQAGPQGRRPPRRQ